MFTGIVDGTAQVVSLEKKKKFHRYTIFLPAFLSENLKIGASVAHNGCCLTVQSIKNSYFTFDVIQETLQKTNLGLLNVGNEINIERSLQYGSEIGGHLTSGHIIDTIEITKIINQDNNYTLWFHVRNINLLKYIFYKGFICIDGISLTVGDIIKNEFSVHLIPETLERTIIKNKIHGDLVNLEIDFYTKIVVDSTERLFLQKKL